MGSTPNVNITRRGPRKWQAVADWGRDRNGKRARAYHTIEGPASEGEAWRAAAEWARTAAQPVTVHDLLTDYIEAKRLNGAAAQTVSQYRKVAKKAAAALPDVSPAEITTLQVSDALHGLIEHGADDGGPLSRSTVAQVYWFLCGAFDWARDVRMVVDDNPVRQADHPQPERREAVALSPADLARLEEWTGAALAGDVPTDANVAMAALVALHAGLRVGEVCGLRACDVGDPRGSVAVRGTVIEPEGRPYRQPKTKTASGMRNVAMDATLAGAVRDHLEWQRGRLDPYGEGSPLVTNGGGWMRPRAVSQRFGETARALGLTPGVTFHSLRHTFATYQLRAGVPIKTVSERLGHAKIGTTLAIYGHMLAGDDEQAARDLDMAYRASVEGVTRGGAAAAGRRYPQVVG